MDTTNHFPLNDQLAELPNVNLGEISENGQRLVHVHGHLESNIFSFKAHLCKLPDGLHLAHTGPVVALEVPMGCAQGWVWIGDVDVLAEIGSSARKVADGVASDDGLHGLPNLLGLVLGVCSRNLHIQKNVGEVQLHLGWNAARDPVLNPLHTSILLKVQEGGYFGRPTEMGDKF